MRLLRLVHDSGFLGLAGLFGPAGAAGGGGRAARRTGGADGGAFVRYLGRAGLVPFGRGPFTAPQFITACVPRVPEPSTLPFWQNTIFCGTSAHVKFFLFLLFFIPGTPKDCAHLSRARSCPCRPACVFSHLHTGAHPVGDHQYLCGQPVRRGKLGREPGGVPCHRGCGGAVRDFSGPHSGRHCRAEGEIQSGKARGFVIYCLWISQQRAGD